MTRRFLSLGAFVAVALAACGGSNDRASPPDTVSASPAISADSAAKLDSLRRVDTDSVIQQHSSIQLGNPFVSVAEAQAVASSSTRPSDAGSGHRAYHWPYVLAALLVVAAGVAWYRKRSHNSNGSDSSSGGYASSSRTGGP